MSENFDRPARHSRAIRKHPRTIFRRGQYCSSSNDAHFFPPRTACSCSNDAPLLPPRTVYSDSKDSPLQIPEFPVKPIRAPCSRPDPASPATSLPRYMPTRGSRTRASPHPAPDPAKTGTKKSGAETMFCTASFAASGRAESESVPGPILPRRRPPPGSAPAGRHRARRRCRIRCRAYRSP